MFPRTRKSQSSDNGGNATGGTTNGASTNGISTGVEAESSINSTIPPNKGGKCYTMNEVFQVWYDNKEQILNPVKELPVNQNENYKLSRPNQIYHLDLQLDASSTSLGNGQSYDSSINTSMHNLSESVDQLTLKNVQVGDELSLSNDLNSDQLNNQNGNVPLSAAHSASSGGPPPGLSHPVSFQDSTIPLLSSDRIEWYYIDPLGTEQGPFNGDMMQEWLTGGYLDLELRIRRKEEFSFKPLKELCESVQNYIQPFKVPLPDLSVQVPQEQPPQHFIPPFGQSHLQQLPLQQQQQQGQFHQFLSNGPGHLGAANMRMNPSLNSQSNLFGNDFINPDPFSPSPLATGFQNPVNSGSQFNIDPIHQNLGFNSPLHNHINTMPSLLQHQIQQQHPQPTLSRNNSGWGNLDAASGLIGNSNPGTPSSVNPVMASQIPQPAPMSPWISGVQSQSRVSSPFIPTNDKDLSTPYSSKTTSANHDNVLDDIHSSVVTDILGENSEVFKVNSQEKAKISEPESQVSREAQVSRESQVSAELLQSVQKQPQAQPAKQAAQHAAEQAKEAEALQTEQESAPVTAPKAVPVQQTLAPWASAQTTQNNTTQKPSLTLKEIQALEAEKLEKQKQLQSQLRSEQAAAKSWAIADEPEEKPALPATSGWATNNKPAVAQKSLAEIQKEEAEAASAKAKAAKSAAIAATASTATPFAAGPIPASYGSSFANTLANSVPKDDAWTTVAAKKPAVKKPVAQSITNSASASRANPQLLRSVSAARPTAPSVNYTALREDFLIWARSSMTNLYPTVSKDDLLDIFITLPASSPDSPQLIAETIYSSSATMDGRRFAQEFLKRRQKVDQQINSTDDIAWTSAIISSANKVQTVDEDGWSTNVKSKKKGKKV